MKPPTPSSTARRFLLAAAVLCVLAIASFLLVNSRHDRAEPETRAGASQQSRSSTAPDSQRAGRSDSDSNNAPAQSPRIGAQPVATTRSDGTMKTSGPLIRTPEGRIDPSDLAEFQPIPFPQGEPWYEGEKVTAYIAVPSTGRKLALTVNQLGEFPRIQTNASEVVEVLLAFSSRKPGDRIAVVAQDGGQLHTGKLSAALQVDDAGQLAFAFTVSPNRGMHRVSVTTPTGELKTLEFWAGEPLALQQLGRK